MKYKVTFEYVVDVDADSRDEARELAMQEFIDNGDYQYANVDVEEI